MLLSGQRAAVFLLTELTVLNLRIPYYYGRCCIAQPFSFESRQWDLHPQPSAYRADALLFELCRQGRCPRIERGSLASQASDATVCLAPSFASERLWVFLCFVIFLIRIRKRGMCGLRELNPRSLVTTVLVSVHGSQPAYRLLKSASEPDGIWTRGQEFSPRNGHVTYQHMLART